MHTPPPNRRFTAAVSSFIRKTISLFEREWQSSLFVVFGPSRISLWKRAGIVRRIRKALKQHGSHSASTLSEQLSVVEAVLSIPSSKQGDIAEFGCYKGMSTVAISIAASHVNRRVRVFDSFRGLPLPVHPVHQIRSGEQLHYVEGAFCGTIDEVRSVVAQHGEIAVVDFVEGFYCHTLPLRPADEKYALIFEDADLVESVRDVLRYAWPRLQPGCLFLSHEALDLEVTKLFFDDRFWQEVHGRSAPGLVGVGTGLPLNFGRWGLPGLQVSLGSCLGAVLKN